MLIPDLRAGRVQQYKNTWTDETGVFSVTGLAPDRYVVVAWLEGLPCELYDPDALETCRAAGKTADIGASERLVLDLRAR